MDKSISVGIVAGMYSMGVIFDKIDSDGIYISVPRNSYDYQESEAITTPEELAKRTKEFLVYSGVLKPTQKFMYKVREETWTKEMADKAMNDTIRNN